jgi:hypothetical protein
MPTGIEEALAALAAAAAALAEAAVAAAPFGPPPTGNTSRVDAAHAAECQQPSGSTDVLDGDPGSTDVRDWTATSTDAQTAPVTGDRPAGSSPPGSVTARVHGPITEYSFEDPLEIVVPGSAPAPPKPPPDPAATTAEDQPAAGADASPSSTQPQYTPPPMLPPMAPPAGEGETLAVDTSAAPPPATGSNGGGEEGSGGIGVPAEWADRWEDNVSWTPSALLFDKSGEELSESLKDGVADLLGDTFGDDPENSEALHNTKAVAATVAKTVADLVIDMGIAPVADPGSFVRGIMRFGTATPYGLRKIENGEYVQGGAMIAGEAGSAVMMVVGGLKQANAVRAAPKEPKITLYLEKVDKAGIVAEMKKQKSILPAKEALEAHNVIEVTIPKPGGGVTVRRSHVVREFITDTDGPAKGPYAKAVEYAQNVGEGDVAYRPGRSVVVSEAAARRAIDAMMKAEKSTAYLGQPGSIGPFSALAENCATYSAMIARQAGVITTGRFGSQVNFFLFKYGPLIGISLTNAQAGSVSNAIGPVPLEAPAR